MAEVHDVFVRLADFLPCPHERKIDIEARGPLLRHVLPQRQLARRVGKTLAHETTDVVEFLKARAIALPGLVVDTMAARTLALSTWSKACLGDHLV
jgi:hypothetical protein